MLQVTGLWSWKVHQATCAGEAEDRLREAFQEAQAAAAEQGASMVLFLDDCDALCPPRDAARPQEARVNAQLLSLLDSLRYSAGAWLDHEYATVGLCIGPLSYSQTQPVSLPGSTAPQECCWVMGQI